MSSPDLISALSPVVDALEHLDLFIVKSRPFDRMAITRHVARPLVEAREARPYLFHSPEDLILNKLEWYRIGGEVSERQWTDILGVMKVQRTVLDLDYLRRWATDLGVMHLLERALSDAGE